MTKVQKARVRKWVDALRSGKYAQTKGRLRELDTDGEPVYCCLGVACELHRLTGKGGKWRGEQFVMKGYEEDSELPAEVSQYFGFGSGDPFISKTITAAWANDGKHWSFKKIATAIEKYYLTPTKETK